MLYYYYFQTRTFIHLFDECNQNWFNVASIIEDSLTTMKRQEPRLNEAFLRSDNAGCYHCAFLLLSLPSLGQRVGVRIARYDFSEAQAGKDICDRRAAALKSHIRRYINEGNDVKTVSDMKAAIDSHGGVKGCYSAVCKVNERSQSMTKHSLSGIQSLNNFVFTESGEIIAWRAFNVGPRKVFSAASLARLGTPQGPTNLQVHQAFSSPDMLTGVFRAPSSTREQQPAAPPMEPIAVEGSQLEEEESVVFGCPEEGCIKVYQSHSSLQRHLDAGKHLLALERESTYDVIKKKWAETCKSISGSYMEAAHPPTSASASVSHSQAEDAPPTADMGWALKKTKKSVHFTTKVRQFLREVFLQGEDTGNKATAEDVAARMRSIRTAEGTKVFTKDEWLTSTQISRYFSRLATLNRSGALHRTQEARPAPTQPVPEGGESEDEEEDPYVAEAPIIRTRLQIRRELEP